MCDQVVTKIKFNELLHQYHKEVLPVIVNDYDSLSVDYEAPLENLHNFFCSLQLECVNESCSSSRLKLKHPNIFIQLQSTMAHILSYYYTTVELSWILYWFNHDVGPHCHSVGRGRQKRSAETSLIAKREEMTDVPKLLTNDMVTEIVSFWGTEMLTNLCSGWMHFCQRQSPLSWRNK